MEEIGLRGALWRLGMAALLALTLAGARAAPPAPVGAWLADGDTLAHAGSVDGSAGGTLGYVGGVFGQAFVFDGGASVTLARNAFRSLATQDTTIVAWLKTATGGDTAAVMFQDQWLLYFDSAQPGRITGVWENWPARLDSGVDLRDGQWHHVASVYDGGIARIYVDGVLRAEGARQRYAGCDVCGVNSFGAGYFGNYVGLIDEVGIFAQALDAGEIAVVMTQGLAAVVPEPGAGGLFAGGLMALLWRRRRRPGAGVSLERGDA